MRIGRIKALGMPHDSELDRILAALATPLDRQSDILLDLRHWAASPACAGSCVKAYFELVAMAPESGAADRPLADLRSWLEAKLNILVFDGEQAVCLEKLPLALDGETDLGEFCHSAMRRLRDDRCLTLPRVRLEFGFAGTPAA
jgi:hypothetical protein